MLSTNGVCEQVQDRFIERFRDCRLSTVAQLWWGRNAGAGWLPEFTGVVEHVGYYPSDKRTLCHLTLPGRKEPVRCAVYNSDSAVQHGSLATVTLTEVGALVREEEGRQRIYWSVYAYNVLQP